MKSTVYRERALLVGIVRDRPGGSPDGLFAELESLAGTAGAQIIGTTHQKRITPTPNYFVGRGKAQEIADTVQADDVDVVIFNNDLSPAQVRNLEQLVGARVIDRSELILDIFATHARTKQAKLQVELAQLEYALPRLRRMWTHLERQEGGVGIGLRGPGEKQIEVDRRLARKRINTLQEEIEEIIRRKEREVAARNENYTVALVGYTNAGKSTLMNALTGAGVVVEDKLFSTLDTKVRLWHFRSGQRVLLSDTVGFIRDLPHHLVASFHATLEEVSTADLLLHVVDASHPEAMDHIDSVHRVLKELHCDSKQTLMIFNKTDRLEDHIPLHVLRNRYPDSVSISALTGMGLDVLEQKVESALADRMVDMELCVPVADGKIQAELAEKGQILDRRFVDEHVLMRVRLPRRISKRYESLNVEGARPEATPPSPAKRSSPD